MSQALFQAAEIGGKVRHKSLLSSHLECAARPGLQTLDAEAAGYRSAVKSKEKEQLSVLWLAWPGRDAVDGFLRLTWTFEPDEEEWESGLCKGAYGRWGMTKRSAGARRGVEGEARHQGGTSV